MKKNFSWPKGLGTQKRRADRGASMLDYSLLGGLIAIASIGAVVTVGGKVTGTFCSAADALGGREAGDCLVEIGVAEAVPTGVEGDDFADFAFALGDTEPHLVLLPVSKPPFDGLTRFEVATNRSGSVEACYEDTSEAVTCTPLSEVANTSAIDLPSQVRSVGYFLHPEDDVRVTMSQPVTLTLHADSPTYAGETWEITATREGAENIFAPSMSFGDQVFAAGTTGEQTILVDLGGDYSEGELSFETTPGAGAFAACFQAADGGEAECSPIETGNQSVVFDDTASSVGYRLALPGDIRQEVSYPLTLRLASTFDTTDMQEWSITVDRPAEALRMSPTFAFQDVSFPPGETGQRTVAEAMTGDFNAAMTLSTETMQIGVCVKASADEDMVCTEPAPPHGSGVSIDVPPDAVEVGYTTPIGDDPFLDYTGNVALKLASKYDVNESSTWNLTVTRGAGEIVFAPTMVFSDQTFPAGSSGIQRVMVPLEGDFNTPLSWIKPDRVTAAPCVQYVEGGPVECDPIYYYGEHSHPIDKDTYAVGYEVSIPGDNLYNDWSSQITMRLRSTKDGTKSQDYVINLERPGEEAVFANRTVLGHHEFPAETTGSQKVFVPLEGDFNTNLRLTKHDRQTMASCVKDTAEANPRCSTFAYYGNYSVEFGPDAHSIGYEISLGTDEWGEINRNHYMTLSSTVDSSKSEVLTLSIHRPAKELVFSNRTELGDHVFPEGTTGSQYVMVPLDGDFNSDLLWVKPDMNAVAACVQAVEGGLIDCTNAHYYGEPHVEVPADAYAIGYRINVSTDEYANWSRSFTFTLKSKPRPGTYVELTGTASRPARQHTYDNRTVFPDKTYPAGTTGTQTEMVALDGDFSSALEWVVPHGYSVAACVQKVEGGTIDCTAASSSGDKIVNVDPGDYAIGYRFGMGTQTDNNWAYTVDLQLRLASDTSKKTDYTVQITRPAE